MSIHLAAPLRSEPEMAAPITVQPAEQPFALDHRTPPRQHRGRRLLHPRRRHPFRRGFALPPVDQTVVAKLLIALAIALAPAPHLSIANADDLGGLPPRDPFRHGAQNHFLYFHRPLHCGLRVREHASHVLLPSPPEKRTDHVLSQPDISCANDIYSFYS